MASTKCYSTKVALTLVVNGLQLAVSHVGNSGLMVSDPCEPIAASNARLLVDIDDSRKVHNIFLPNGLPGPGEFVQFF